MKPLIPIFLVLSCLAASSLAQPVTAEERSFRAEPIFQIRTDSEEHLLSYPWHISTDSRGRIYVADYATADIKLFDSDGDFLRTIGRRGRGPGEFQRIAAMHLDRQDQLVVADGVNSRLTVFDGNFREKFAWQYEERIPQKIIDFNDSYLLAYLTYIPLAVLRNPDADIDRDKANKLFHLVSRDLKTPENEFGDFRELQYPETYSDHPDLRNLNMSRFGWVRQHGESSVVYTPYVYDGKLYRMDLNGSSEFVQGYARNKDKIFGTVLRDGEEREAMNAESVGLCRVNSGRYIHFSLQRRDGGYDIYAELFDEDLRLLRYGRLYGITDTDVHPPGDYSGFRVDHCADGRFYAIDYNADFSGVWVFEIEGIQ